MANLVAKLVGWVLLLVGIAGFFAPHLAGAHLSPAHNLVHIVSGGVSLWCGMGSVRAARTFCLLFGAVYGLLGIAGFAFGEPGDRMLRVLPGVLELGTVDHVIHVALGAIYLVAALATRPLAAASRA